MTAARKMDVHFSSKKDDWGTPQDLFDKLNEEFQFTLDVCATKKNAKCARFFTRKQDGLQESWEGEHVWCNPPYGRKIGSWVWACSEAGRDVSGAPDLAVMLVPARPDTQWWHRLIWDKRTHKPRSGVEVRFLEGRLTFEGAENPAPFPSAIVVFRGPK